MRKLTILILAVAMILGCTATAYAVPLGITMVETIDPKTGETTYVEHFFVPYGSDMPDARRTWECMTDEEVLAYFEEYAAREYAQQHPNPNNPLVPDAFYPGGYTERDKYEFLKDRWARTHEDYQLLEGTMIAAMYLWETTVWYQPETGDFRFVKNSEPIPEGYHNVTSQVYVVNPDYDPRPPCPVCGAKDHRSAD